MPTLKFVQHCETVCLRAQLSFNEATFHKKYGTSSVLHNISVEILHDFRGEERQEGCIFY